MDEVTKEEYELAEKYLSEYDIKFEEEKKRAVEFCKNGKCKDNGKMNKKEQYWWCREQQKGIGASIDEVVEVCGSVFDYF